MARPLAGARVLVTSTAALLRDRLVEAPLFYLRWLPQLWVAGRLACPGTGRRIAYCVCLPCVTTRSD